MSFPWYISAFKKPLDYCFDKIQGSSHQTVFSIALVILNKTSLYCFKFGSEKTMEENVKEYFYDLAGGGESISLAVNQTTINHKANNKILCTLNNNKHR